MKENRVRSISEYVAAVDEISSQLDDDTTYTHWWFRGIGHIEFKLQPRLYRGDGQTSANQEPNIRLEFLNRALPYVSAVYDRKPWDWYFLMQHYRVPTRLLDWTESALVALYFALYTHTSSYVSPPCVWMLNPHELNAVSLKRSQILTPCEDEIESHLPSTCSGPITGRLPIALCPQRADRRMTAQLSTFTLHGNIDAAIEDIPETKQLVEERKLVRLIIDIAREEGLDRLKRQLTVLGIRNSTIFPDLEGLAMDICEDYAPM